MKRLMCLGVMLVMCISAGIFSACTGGRDMDYGYVLAYIKKEYNEKFDAKEFVIEDFEFENMKDFSYFYHHKGDEIDNKHNRYILIELDKTGKKYAEQAIKHLSTLGFIERTDFKNRSANPGIRY